MTQALLKSGENITLEYFLQYDSWVSPFYYSLKNCITQNLFHQFDLLKDELTSIYLEFPLGLEIDVFSYQLLFFPFILNNTSNKQRIRRFSIFLESSDDRKN